jgi:hypothetical protein
MGEGEGEGEAESKNRKHATIAIDSWVFFVAHPQWNLVSVQFMLTDTLWILSSL